ncbi:MAG: glycosyltransferase [Bryobacteraceae bacterium]|nr:glycosyltransferase [Bryobacteraceae bacterium]
MPPPVVVAACSASPARIPAFLARLKAQFPDHEVCAIAEFAPDAGTWIPYHPQWTLAENLARCRADLAGRPIAYTALMLEPRIPGRNLRWIAFRLRPLHCLFFNENLDHFLLRPRSAPQMVRHLLWRAGNWIRLQARPYAGWRKWLRRLARPAFRRALWLKWTRPLRWSGGGGGGQLRLLEGKGLRGTGPWRRQLRAVFLSALRGNPESLKELASAPVRLRRTPAEVDRALQELAMRTCVSEYEGRPTTGKPALVIAAPYAPFPLSHGGAVRMYNLMRRAADGYDQVLVVFTERFEPPPVELLRIFTRVIQVQRVGSHSRPLTGRPDTVEEFDQPAFHAALRAAVAEFCPGIVQLEYTRMAMYHADCAPARTILVEHDVKVDLYRKLLAGGESWEWRQQLERWRRFESEAWRRLDAIVVMSEQDRQTVGERGVVLPNGVDIERFAPSGESPEPARLLFIGTFGHLPNLLALEFFLNQVWPLLGDLRPALHVIAGREPGKQLRHYANRVSLDLDRDGIEVEGFVADVRPAYRRAAVVIAPLTASAGTNIKVLEAMAMGKAVVSTPAGVNGLDVRHDHDVLITAGPREMAGAIRLLLSDGERRRRIEAAARQTVVDRYDWDVIAERQAELYRKLRAGGGPV